MEKSGALYVSILGVEQTGKLLTNTVHGPKISISKKLSMRKSQPSSVK